MPSVSFDFMIVVGRAQRWFLSGTVETVALLSPLEEEAVS